MRWLTMASAAVVCVPVGAASGSTVNVCFGSTRPFIGPRPKFGGRRPWGRNTSSAVACTPQWGRLSPHGAADEHFHEEDVRGVARRRRGHLVTRSRPSCACVCCLRIVAAACTLCDEH